MGIEDCDVFLSFRGEVRNNFTCYLYEELKRQGYEPFMDTENINIGDEIHETIKKAIKYSKSAIIVFSENYASSKHCLTELVHILERNRTSKYFIIPIFYYVTADDVKRNSDDKVEVWRAALAMAGDILAQEINEKDPRTESKIIADIVALFKQKFSMQYPKVQISNSNTISQQNQNLTTPKIITYGFDIEEAAVVVSEKNVNPNTSKDEHAVSGTWISNNPKLFTFIVIIVLIIISFTVIACNPPSK